MQGLRTLNPDKLVRARGERPRSEIVRNGNHRFTEQDLYNYEKGNNLPSQKKLPFVIAALGVTWEQISDEMEAVAA